MESKRQSYGVLKKCEFHFHTPASHDYELIKNKDYHKLTLEKILDYSVLVGYLTNQNMQEIINNIDYYKSEEYFKELKDGGKPFVSFKEYISYMLIAHKMFKEEIEVAVITDHNTVQGFKKLDYALEEYFQVRIKGQSNNFKKPIHLFLGVEISCSEQNHLIAIFENKKFKEVQAFLEEIIISEEEGTYCTSEHLLKEIASLDGLSYIAHLNSSKLHGSGLYNKTLFSSPLMNVFGLTNLKSEVSQRNRIRHHNKIAAKNLGVIHESDSHSVDTIGLKNTWVKFSKVSFAALKKAFKNHSINIYPEKPNKSDVFIKGLSVIPGNTGFLINKGSKSVSEPFSVDFSRDLNCIIGGRGTGKSTIVNIIEVALTQEVEDKKTLEFIAKHERIYIFFHYKDSEYILEFIPQIKNIHDEYYTKDIFLDKAFVKNIKEKIVLSSNWTTLYRVEQENFTKLNPQEKTAIFQNMYRRSYSINSIINKINMGRVDDFIRDMVLYGLDGDDFSEYLERLKSIPARSFNKYIRENLEKMIISIEDRKKRINSLLTGFNQEYNDLLEIVYSPKQKNTDFYLHKLLEELSSNKRLLNTLLTWDDVARYIQEFSKNIGFMEFLKLIMNKKYTILDKELSISKFVDEANIRYADVVLEYKEINSKNKNQIYDEIYNSIIKKRELLEYTLVKWFEVIDEFNLKFNVNSKEQTSTQGPFMKDVAEMSLGQKVVAILSFVFNYGYYIKDNTPLIIDQPEDNLDNQYIYKNLVESLKQIKNNRQVIIVTHNSTIVTNSDTEQVIVMESNNNKGWIENKGYPSDERIAKHIINCLEGGIESFNHKMTTYSLFVEDLKNN